MKQEIKIINEIRSNNFTTKKDFIKEYKSVKDNFKNQLGYNIMKQGLIILCKKYKDKYIMITNSTKEDMEIWIKEHKHLNEEYFLLIKEQRFLIKSR